MGAGLSAPLPKEGAKTLLRNYRLSEKDFVWYKEFGVSGKLDKEQTMKLLLYMSYEMPAATEKLLKFLEVDGCVLRRDIPVFGPLVRERVIGPFKILKRPDFGPSGALTVADAKDALESEEDKKLLTNTVNKKRWAGWKFPKTRRAVSRKLGTLKARCKRRTPFYISLTIIPIANTNIAHRNFVIVNPVHNTILWIEPGGALDWMNNPTYEKGFREGLMRIGAELGLKSPRLIEPDLKDGETLYRKVGAETLPKGWAKTSWVYKALTGLRYYSKVVRVSVRNRPRSEFLLPQFIARDVNCTFWTYFILLHLLLNPSFKSPREVIERFYKAYDSQSRQDLLAYVDNFKFFLYHKLFGPAHIEKALRRLNRGKP